MQQITFGALGSSQMTSASGGEKARSQQELPTTAHHHAQSPGEDIPGAGRGRLAMPVPRWYVISWPDLY